MSILILTNVSLAAGVAESKLGRKRYILYQYIELYLEIIPYLETYYKLHVPIQNGNNIAWLHLISDTLENDCYLVNARSATPSRLALTTSVSCTGRQTDNITMDDVRICKNKGMFCWSNTGRKIFLPLNRILYRYTRVKKIRYLKRSRKKGLKYCSNLRLTSNFIICINYDDVTCTILQIVQ